MEGMESDTEPSMAEVQRRLLVEEKEKLESEYGVHIGSDALSTASQIAARYFDDGGGTVVHRECHLQKQAANLLQKACFKLRYELGTSQEEKELDIAEYSLHRAIVEIMELRKERNPVCKPWHSRVKAELKDLMNKLDDFMLVRNPKMPLLQNESSKRIFFFLKAYHQKLDSLSSVHRGASLLYLQELVSRLAANIPEAFKGDLTVTPSLIAEVAKPLTGVPSPLLMHTLRLQIPGLKKQLDEKCLGDEFAVLQIVNALSRPKQADRPVGAFLFLGADDHKIERYGLHLAEALSETLFENKDLIELDICTTSLEQVVERLLEVKRRPFAVILLKNIDKAQDSVIDLLVKILTCGSTTDELGGKVDFNNTLFIMVIPKVRALISECACHKLVTEGKHPIKELLESNPGEIKHGCRFPHFLEQAKKRCPMLVDLVDDIVFLTGQGEFNQMYTARVALRGFAHERGLILYPSDASLKRKSLHQFWLLNNKTGIRSWFEETVAPVLQGMLLGNKLSYTSVIYLDEMVRSEELSYRLADCGALLEDRHYKQFKGSLIEFRDLYRKEKKKVQSVYLLRLKLFDIHSNENANWSRVLAEIQCLIDILEDLCNFPFAARSNEAGHKVEPSCMHDEAIMHEGKSNKKAKMGIDNLLMTLSAKSLHQFVATDVIENALLKLIKDGPVNPSWGPPNSYLFLGLHGHSKAHLANYLNENLVTGDGVPLLVDIDLSDFSDDGALLRLKNELPRFDGDGQPGSSSQIVGDMKVRPYSIILFNHVEKAHISVFSALLSTLDVGVCRDGQGTLIDFSQTIIVLTSDLGNRRIITRLFEEQECKQLDPIQVDGDFRSELLNSVDEILFFNPVAPHQTRVARLQMRNGPHLHVRISNLPVMLFFLFKDENDYFYGRHYDWCGDALRRYVSYMPEHPCSFQIFIEISQRKIITIKVNSADVVSKLKAQIEEIEEIPAHKQFLTFLGKQLMDDDVLCDCKIYRESCLHLL